MPQDQKAGDIKSNLKGIGLGDGWIAPMDFVNTWAEFLLQTVLLALSNIPCARQCAKKYSYISFNSQSTDRIYSEIS